MKVLTCFLLLVSVQAGQVALQAPRPVLEHFGTAARCL